MNLSTKNLYLIITLSFLILNGIFQSYGQTYTYNIKLAAHIVRDGNGNYGLSNPEGTLQTLIDNINEKYTDQNQTDIHFELAYFDFIDNSYYTEGDQIEFRPNGFQFDDPKLLSLFSERNIPGVIHIYFIAKQFTTDAADGVVEDIPGNKIVLTNEAALFTTTLAHEVAHSLGLLHSYETNKLTIQPTNSISWSDGGQYDPEWVNRSGNCVNWSTNGDLIEDTPADPIATEGDIAKFLDGCVFENSNNIRDNSLCQTPYYNTVLIHNIMAYNTGCSRYQFTNDQIQRMHDFLDDRLLYLKNTVKTTIANKFDDNVITDDENQISTLSIDGADFSSNDAPFLNDGEHTGKTNQERFEDYLSNDIKHHDWNLNVEEFEYRLSENFSVDFPTPYERTAYFNEMNSISSINIIAENTVTLEAPVGDVEFKDPWYLFTGDVQKENQNDAWISNDDPNWFTGAYNQSTGGIFLDEEYIPSQPNKPYYSVRVPVSQQIQINNRQHTFSLYEWTGDVGASIVNPNNRETPIVFNAANSTITAILKGTNLSDDTKAYDNNSQRKFVRTGSGDLHSVYTSLGALWYERSTDEGGTWEIMNSGRRINSEKPKGVSIDYLPGTDVVLITYQRQISSGSQVVIDVFIDGEPRTPINYRYSVTSFNHPASEYDDINIEPVIALAEERDFLVVYKMPAFLPINGNSPATLSGLFYSYGWLNPLLTYQLAWYTNDVHITNTGTNSVHPSIAGQFVTGGQEHNYFHLAYENNSSIYYWEASGQSGTGSLSQTNPVNISSGYGFTQNYDPSIIAMGSGARVCWTGYRKIFQDEEQYKLDEAQAGGGTPQYKVVFRDPNNPSRAWQFGSNVSSPNFNKQNDNTYYAFAWSENLSQIKFADNSLSTVRTIDNVTGQKPQMSNGPDKNNMYCMSYEYNSGVPYYFTMSDDLGSYYQLPKTNYFAFTSGREGILSIDGAEFYFSLGDIQVDGQPIDFIEIADSVSVNNLSTLNEYMVTDPINISDNSDFIYSVQYGINDSLSASQAILEDMLINFKVMLIDNSTGEIIGIHDDVTYDSENIYQYNNISYRVNTEGIGNRSVRLKLLVEDNFTPVYSLSKIYSDESVLGKTTLKEINYQGSGVITTYDLSQNYPNPFNPSTIIKYQIPASGNVTLKIYDILGREVTTLIEEFKTEGRYEVNFNASSLASDVYLYRLNVNDYVDVKKMILLK